MIRSRSRTRDGGGGGSSAPGLYYRAIDDTVAKPSSTINFRYSDSLLPMRNDTGNTLTSCIVAYKNRVDSASVEFNITGTTTVRCSVDYLGTRYLGYTVSGGAIRDLVMTAGGDGLLYVDGLNIPAGASFNVLTWADNNVASGHPSGLSNNAGMNGGTAKSFRSAADSTDYTASGAPAWSSGTGYCPWAVLNYSSGNPSKLFGIFGDSQLRGSFTNNLSLATIACTTKNFGFINCGFSGQTIAQSANIVERLADMIAAGVTDIIVGYPVNDLSVGGVLLATLQSNSTAFWTRIRTALPASGKLIALTCPPRVVDNTAPGTEYATGGFTGGASSIRAQYNAWLRSVAGTGAAYPTHYYELADFLESSRDSGLFANPTVDVQADGLHYTSTAQTNAGADLAAYLTSIGF